MGIQRVEQYTEFSLSEFVEQSRIRTKKRRKQASIKDNDKKLIRFYKEGKKLRKQKFDLPMIDLVPPIQRGWKRYFVLRDDVRRSKQGVFYENLLQKINTFQYNPDKTFKQKKRKEGKRIYVERKQELRIIYPCELPKFKLNERELACFEYRNIQEIRGKRIYEKYGYIFKEPWRFVLRIRPNMIDKVQVFDSELEQRIAELDGILYDNSKNKGRIYNIRGNSVSRRWISEDKPKYKYHLKDKTKQLILE